MQWGIVLSEKQNNFNCSWIRSLANELDTLHWEPNSAKEIRMPRRTRSQKRKIVLFYSRRAVWLPQRNQWHTLIRCRLTRTRSYLVVVTCKENKNTRHGKIEQKRKRIQVANEGRWNKLNEIHSMSLNIFVCALAFVNSSRFLIYYFCYSFLCSSRVCFLSWNRDRMRFSCRVQLLFIWKLNSFLFPYAKPHFHCNFFSPFFLIPNNGLLIASVVHSRGD